MLSPNQATQVTIFDDFNKRILSITHAELEKFHDDIYYGANVKTPEGRASVAGVCEDGLLWFELEKEKNFKKIRICWPAIKNPKTFLAIGISIFPLYITTIDDPFNKKKLNIRHAKLDKFHDDLYYGAVVTTREGRASVAGVCEDGLLWFELDKVDEKYKRIRKCWPAIKNPNTFLAAGISIIPQQTVTIDDPFYKKELNIRHAKLDKFHDDLYYGAIVTTPEGRASVAGVCKDGLLWFELDKKDKNYKKIRICWPGIKNPKTFSSIGIVILSKIKTTTITQIESLEKITSNYIRNNTKPISKTIRMQNSNPPSNIFYQSVYQLLINHALTKDRAPELFKKLQQKIKEENLLISVNLLKEEVSELKNEIQKIKNDSFFKPKNFTHQQREMIENIIKRNQQPSKKDDIRNKCAQAAQNRINKIN